MKYDFSRANIRAYLALSIGILSLGFSAFFVSWANAPGAVTGFYRTGIATVVLAIPFYRRQQTIGRLTRREVAIAFLAGLFFASDLLFWNTGVLMSGATNPTLMGNTAPLWVGLGALMFFREKLSRPFWLGLLLAMGGAAVILGLDALNDVGLGTFFGLLAGIFYGAYFLVTQRSRQKLDSLTSFWLAVASSTLILFIAAQVFHQPITGYPNFTYLNFLGMGLIVQVVGQLAINYALGYLPASLVAPTMLGQPVLTAVLAGPLLHEYLSEAQVVGGIAVLLGVYIVHRSRMKVAPVEYQVTSLESGS